MYKDSSLTAIAVYHKHDLCVNEGVDSQPFKVGGQKGFGIHGKKRRKAIEEKRER